jgi:cytoskeletal protein RodZ
MTDIVHSETHTLDFNSSSTQSPESIFAQHEEEEGMEEVASMLKRAREDKGISLKDAEMETRVPTHYLQILEGEGDSRLLADVLYLIPFLRTYSVFLGLDPAVTIPQFIMAVQKGETLSSSPINPSRRLFSRKATIFFIVIVLIALSLLWIVGEHG